MGIYVFTDPGTLTSAPLHYMSNHMGQLSGIASEFMVVLYSHNIACVVIYTNISPHTAFKESPLLDSEFRAHVFLATEKYIDYYLSTSNVNFDKEIIEACNRLKQICRDYT